MKEPHNVLADSVLQGVADRLGQERAVAAAYLLGSAANGRLRADSDVDIALLPVRGAAISGLERVDLAADLELLLGRPVDLGILHTGNLVYAKEAVAHGKLLFERDRTARVRFGALVLSMYADLQENRREVIHAYAA
ncbi:MAG: nucleotidyltransferase domain-containing protein [Chthoniobacterales bacterium]|nr:nucleotidyltransferase domain-containing protein [Chthoniobacterales bacterium]